MWTHVRQIALLCAIVLLAGCDSVVMEHPIGEVISDENGRKLDGIWQAGKGLAHFKYVSDGRLVVASLEWNRKMGAFEKKELTVSLTQLGDKILATIYLTQY